MREQCEVNGDGCEVFTRCVVLYMHDNRRVVACPTCAEGLGVDPAYITRVVTEAVESEMREWDAEASTNEALDTFRDRFTGPDPLLYVPESEVGYLPMANGELVPVTHPHHPACPHMLEYVDLTLSLAYGPGVALCQ